MSFKLLQAMPFRNLILLLGVEDSGSSLRIILFMVTVLNFDCLQAFAFKKDYIILRAKHVKSM